MDLNYSNLWEFLQLQYKVYNPDKHSPQLFKNPLNGKYFKFEDKE